MPSLMDMPELSLSLSQKKALMKGLTVDFHHRYQTMDELYRGLYQEEEKSFFISRCWKVAGVTAGIVVLTAAAFLIPGIRRNKTIPKAPAAVVQTTEAAVTAVPFTTGIQEYKMGSFTGMKKKAAARKLREQDGSLSIRWVYKYNNKVKKGRIISQSISRGTRYAEGSYRKIVFTVSKGKKRVFVPVKTNVPTPVKTNVPATAVPHNNTSVPSKNTLGKNSIEFEGAIP